MQRKTVTGTVKDSESGVSEIKINGMNILLKKDGSFAGTVSLKEGKNTLTVVATDRAGNEVTKTVKVVLDTTPPELIINAPSVTSKQDM